MITGRHFSISAVSRAASSSGVEPTATMPMLSKFALTAGSRSVGDRINVDFVDDRGRCPPRNEEREPSRHVETGHASLRNARQLRCQWAALGGSHRNFANRAAPFLLKHRAAADPQVHPP